MADHIWRWQAAEEFPSRLAFGGDGWYVCIACGANDYDPEAERAIPAQCPRNRPTAVYCRCPDHVHAASGSPQFPEQETGELPHHQRL
jgi:hypothetical protein